MSNSLLQIKYQSYIDANVETEYNNKNIRLNMFLMSTVIWLKKKSSKWSIQL